MDPLVRQLSVPILSRPPFQHYVQQRAYGYGRLPGNALQGEATSNPDLARVLRDVSGPTPVPLGAPPSPLVLTRVRTEHGELRFLSTFTTFGMPLDITVASLRIEHLIPADDHTWQRMKAAYDQWSAVGAETPDR